MNINYKENGGNKSFSCKSKAFLANPKHQYPISQWGEHDCSDHNKKNIDYHEYPSLSHFIDER